MARIATEASSVKVNSIVRVLRGPLAGRLGVVTRVAGGRVAFAVVAPELKRRRRYHSVQIETGLRTRGDLDAPHLNPQVGDEVYAVHADWSGRARICALTDEAATVCASYVLHDMIVSIPLRVEHPVLEVLFEPVMRLSDGTNTSLNVNLGEAFAIPLHANLADALSEFLLETLEARGGSL